MRTYAIWGTATSPEHEAWVRSVGSAFESDGFTLVDDIADADFVLNMFDARDPKAFRRQSRGTYSASFYELDAMPEDVLKTSYPMLVRTLANVVVLHVPVAACGSPRWSAGRTRSPTTRMRSSNGSPPSRSRSS